MEESDLSPMDTGVSAIAPLLPSHHWLLVRLPSLPLFECVKLNICSDLRHVSIVHFLASNIDGVIFAATSNCFDMFFYVLRRGRNCIFMQFLKLVYKNI